MQIPDTLVYEIGVGVLTLVGIVLGFLMRLLIAEIKHLRHCVEAVQQQIAETKEDLFEVATVVASCTSCPHPDIKGLLQRRKRTKEVIA